MKSLASQDGDDHIGLALIFQGLEIMGHRQQVDLGRQLHGRMAPVAVGENPQLAGVHKGLEPLLHGLHLFMAV